MGSEKYDIFISYRREGGEFTAGMLAERLKQRGYSAFFDVEGLRSGNFNEKLFSVIDGCTDFLLVLSPDALARCDNPADWVRLELERALEGGKNVIPIMMRGFHFPEKLPESIDSVRHKNGIEASMMFFDAMVNRLCEQFLQSEPTQEEPPPVEPAKEESESERIAQLEAEEKKRRRRRMVRIAIISAVIVALACAGLVARYVRTTFPLTGREKSVVSELLYYTQTHLTGMDIMSGGAQRAVDAVRRFLNTGSTEEAALRDALELAREEISGSDQQSCAPEADFLDRVASLRGAPFQGDDLVAMHDIGARFQQNWLGYVDYLEQVADPDTYLQTTDRLALLDMYEAILQDDLKGSAYCANELLLPITKRDVLSEFKGEYLPTLLRVPLSAASWSTDADALESEIKAVLNREEAEVMEASRRVGELNLDVAAQREALVEAYMQQGATREVAERIVEKELQIADLSAQLAPEEGDGEEVLWRKLSISITEHYGENAARCVDALEELVGDSDPFAAEYIPALRGYLAGAEALGIDYGTMVVSWADPEKPSERYHIGDVIIAFNGEVCRNFDEYSTMKGALTGEEFRVTVLRADEAGTLKQVELDMRTDMQPAYMISLDDSALLDE